jgi:integrase
VTRDACLRLVKAIVLLAVLATPLVGTSDGLATVSRTRTLSSERWAARRTRTPRRTERSACCPPSPPISRSGGSAAAAIRQPTGLPVQHGTPWTQAAYQSWRRRAFKRALDAANLQAGRAYDLRHSFVSLLLHEGRSVIYIARQLGHDARLTHTTYGHVIDEFDETPRIDAQASIAEARAALKNQSPGCMGVHQFDAPAHSDSRRLGET